MRVLQDDEYIILVESLVEEPSQAMTDSEEETVSRLVVTGHLVEIELADRLEYPVTARGKLAVRCHEAYLRSVSGGT